MLMMPGFSQPGLVFDVSLHLGTVVAIVALEWKKIVEAVLLMGALGFESTGLAAAHAIHNGFTVLEETHSISHGEKVAFGVLAMQVLENRPKADLARPQVPLRQA